MGPRYDEERKLQREDGHEQVADGEDVGRHREGGGGLHQHPQLHGEGETVEEGGHDGDGEAGCEEGAAEAGVEERHAAPEPGVSRSDHSKRLCSD